MTAVTKTKSTLRATAEQEQIAQQVMESVLIRSTTDRAFRQKLKSNPRAAFAEYAGKSESDIPESFHLNFIENEATATIVLPEPVSTGEVSDSELETVSGGSWVICGEIAMVVIFIADTLHEAYMLGKEAK